MQRLKLATIALAAMVAMAVTAPIGASAQTATGTATVLHGVPGLDVDVYANGELLIEGFAPGDQFGPADLPAGDYEIAIRPAGAESTSEPAITGRASLSEGANVTLVAHLDADGAPTLSVFVNDVSTIDPGNTRVVVRHTAAFGAVDVLAGGAPVVENLENPDDAALEVPAGQYALAVTAAGDPSTEAIAADLNFGEGTAYFAHAIGDPTAGTFDLLVSTVEGLQTAPERARSGSGGLLAEDGSGFPIGMAAAVVVGAAGGLALLALRFRRPATVRARR